MPTSDYRNAQGERLPGTTTVIGGNLGWNKGPLMYWAWSQGKEGKNYRDTSQAAADAGTLAHYLAECDITGQVPDPARMNVPAEVLKNAEGAFGAYLSWKEMSRVRIVASEVALVSNQHQYGGTLDGIGQLGEKYCLIDFKTSNGTYADHLIQLAAYQHLWEENHPDQLLTGGFHLLRFGKEHGDFHHHFYPDLAPAFEAFLALRRLHDYKRILEKRAA